MRKLISMPKPVCIIPARGGSKGVERKNIKNLGGKPLIAYAIESARKSQLFQDVIVSTEDNEIAEISKEYGARVPFMRPKNLATDLTTTEEVLVHAINELKKLNFEFDTIMLRDCTVPFIDDNDMRKALERFSQPYLKILMVYLVNILCFLAKMLHVAFLHICAHILYLMQYILQREGSRGAACKSVEKDRPHTNEKYFSRYKTKLCDL